MGRFASFNFKCSYESGSDDLTYAYLVADEIETILL